MTAVPGVWARAYRPLRPRTLTVQLVVLVVAEVALFRSYSVHDARFHWATYFLVALAYTAALLLGRLLLTGAPGPRYLLLTILGFHLFAMTPDLLFRGGIPHSQWMNVFLGHIAVHYLPGGDQSWLLIALVVSGAYVLALTMWLRARQLEALQGLPPGVGLTGAAVLRPQRDPRTTGLAHQDLAGPGPAVVLLHGLGATAAFWAPVAEQLAAAGARVLSPDLLGFGASLRIGTHFHLDDQASAVIRLLDAHTLDSVALVGHSYGAVVAGAVAYARPDLIEQLVLVSPAVFVDAGHARSRIGGRSWLARKTMDGSPVADLSCGAMCLLRRPLTTLAPRVAARSAPGVSAEVARGAVTYVWPAYRDALASLLGDNPLLGWLRHPLRPTTVLLATGDHTVPPGELQELLGPDVTVLELPGTHTLPLEQPVQVAHAILTAADAGEPGPIA